MLSSLKILNEKWGIDEIDVELSDLFTDEGLLKPDPFYEYLMTKTDHYHHAVFEARAYCEKYRKLLPAIIAERKAKPPRNKNGLDK